MDNKSKKEPVPNPKDEEEEEEQDEDTMSILESFGRKWGSDSKSLYSKSSKSVATKKSNATIASSNKAIPAGSEATVLYKNPEIIDSSSKVDAEINEGRGGSLESTALSEKNSHTFYGNFHDDQHLEVASPETKKSSSFAKKLLLRKKHLYSSRRLPIKNKKCWRKCKKSCCCCCEKKKNMEVEKTELIKSAHAASFTPEGMFPDSTYMIERKRRTRVADRPNVSSSIFIMIKSIVGKELSKISMPVNFNEPLTMIQRITEDYEYSHLLDQALQCKDSLEQLCYIGVFTIAAYCNSDIRIGKPFNPLLGETFECDRRDDYGWRCITEKISHAPPIASQHCEGKGWTCWQEFTMTSKWHTNSIEIVPQGVTHLLFNESSTMDKGHLFTWTKVNTLVRNIIVGKLTIDNIGENVIRNHLTDEVCVVTYHPTTGMFSKDEHKVTGKVLDKDGNVKWLLYGRWDSKMEASPVGETKKTSEELEKFKFIWSRKKPVPESAKYYNMTEFACQLNELEEGIAPTDSRLRPDQRLMENGNFDDANLEKHRLEEKQRAKRRLQEIHILGAPQSQASIKLENEEEFHRPAWFQKSIDEVTGHEIYKYTGEYWSCKEKQEWSRCPDIF